MPPFSDSSPNELSSSPFKEELIPLIRNYSLRDIFVVHAERKISQHEFLSDLYKILPQLPTAEYAVNLCEDRYYFLLTFCALLLKGTTNLLPSNRTPTTLSELSEKYPNSYCVVDKNASSDAKVLDISTLVFANNLAPNPKGSSSSSTREYNQPPMIPASQIAAIAFTSGSTGTPKPNIKYFGALAVTAQLLGQRLTADLISPTIVATVPSQHMYGLETTIMMALQSGLMLNTQKPFFPSDVQSVLQSIETPIVLVTTPTHLRAMVKSELKMPPLAALISATAPLDIALAEESEDCFCTHLSEIYGCTEVGSLATREPTRTQTWQLLDGYTLATQEEGVAVSSAFWLGAVALQDQIERLDSHTFLLRGRGTDMINVAGKRASLSDLSLQLQRIVGVKDAVVFLPELSSSVSQDLPIQNAPQTQNKSQEVRPAAFVVSDRSEKEILADLTLCIDAAFIPRPLLKVNALPRSETGKLPAAALNSLWRQLRESK